MACSATPETTVVENVALDHQSRTGATALAVIEEDGVGRAADRRIQVAGVLENDVGRFAAQFQLTFLRFPAAARTMILPTSVEPVKATLSTSSWPASAAPAVSPKPVTILTTPSGSPASISNSPKRKRGKRSLLGRLEHDAIARGQRGAEFPSRHQQREIPRNDLPDDADRLAQREGVKLRVGAYGTLMGMVLPSIFVAQPAM